MRLFLCIDDEKVAVRTHLVLQLAVCFLVTWPWPQVDGICGLCPSPKQDAPWFGRLVWHWEIPGLSFVSNYRSEPPDHCGLSRWGCTYESELRLCSCLAAWT